MKKSLCLIVVFASPLTGIRASSSPTELDELRTRLREANAAFAQAVQQHQAAIERLTRRIEALEAVAGASQAATAATLPASDHELPADGADGGLPRTPTTPNPAPAVSAWSPSQPITLAGNGASYVNLSFDALMAAGGSSSRAIESLQFGGHDPKQNGFTVQNLELTLDGAVDPYFRGQANLISQLDVAGDTTFEVEEAYLASLALPWGLELKAGQYLSPFGRINPTHPHTWDFVDQPLVIGRLMGPDGLRNPGAQLSWLAPTPFYSELTLSVQNSQGETAFSFRNEESAPWLGGRPAAGTSVRGLSDLLYVPRYALSLDLGDEHTIVWGVSGAFGPNAAGGDTRIYGTDLFYRWKSQYQQHGFPFVTWQTEFLYRDYAAAAFRGDLAYPPRAGRVRHDWGAYSQVSYGFRQRWVASLRGDFATGESGDFTANPLAQDRVRVSPALTFYPSEFSKLRLQYNYDDIQHTGIAHSVWVQLEFLLGAHAAHQF